MMGGSGFSWTKCKSFAPRFRQTTMPSLNFTDQMLFLTSNQQCQSTKGNKSKAKTSKSKEKHLNQNKSKENLNLNQQSTLRTAHTRMQNCRTQYSTEQSCQSSLLSPRQSDAVY